MEAMKVEYEALMKNQTWDLVPYPIEKNMIGNKGIYKVNFNLVGYWEIQGKVSSQGCHSEIQRWL